MKKDYYAHFIYWCEGVGAWCKLKKKCKLAPLDYFQAHDPSLNIITECEGKLIYEGSTAISWS